MTESTDREGQRVLVDFSNTLSLSNFLKVTVRRPAEVSELMIILKVAPLRILCFSADV